MVLEFSLKGLPPSVNSLYATFRGRRIKSRVGKAWTESAIFQLSLQLTKQEKVDFKDKPLRAEVELYRETWHCKTKGKAHKFFRIDLDNRLKSILDAVFEAIGLDDSQVVDLSIIKCVGREERTIVRLSETDE